MFLDRWGEFAGDFIFFKGAWGSLLWVRNLRENKLWVNLMQMPNIPTQCWKRRHFGQIMWTTCDRLRVFNMSPVRGFPLKVEEIFLFSAQNHPRPLRFKTWVRDIPAWQIYSPHYKDKSELLIFRYSPHFFPPSLYRQATHQNRHYLLVSSLCRLEKGNIDLCQGLNVFILIPPPSPLCHRQTPTNTEHLNNSSSQHQVSILQEVEVTD